MTDLKVFRIALFLVLSALFTGIQIAHANESESDSMVMYFHHDLRGDPVVVTQDSGNILWVESYLAYGSAESRLSSEGIGFEDNNFENSISRKGTTGHQKDSASNLTYMKARYYDPLTSRFYSNDPIGFIESEPMMFNRYIYAYNSPYTYTDPTGMIPVNGPAEKGEPDTYYCTGGCDYKADNKKLFEEDGRISIEEAAYNAWTHGNDLGIEADSIRWVTKELYPKGQGANARPSKLWDFIVIGTVSFAKKPEGWTIKPNEFDFDVKKEAGNRVRNYQTEKLYEWLNTPSSESYLGLPGLKPADAFSTLETFHIHFNGTTDLNQILSGRGSVKR